MKVTLEIYLDEKTEQALKEVPEGLRSEIYSEDWLGEVELYHGVNIQDLLGGGITVQVDDEEPIQFIQK